MPRISGKQTTVRPIDPNMAQAREVGSRLAEQIAPTILIMHVRTRDMDAQEDSLSIHQQMALASIHLLVGIPSVSPPFSVVLTD